MPKVTIDQEGCKGCSLCIRVCPKKIMQLSAELNRKGYHPAEVSDMDECTGCTACAVMCPDCVIMVEK